MTATASGTTIPSTIRPRSWGLRLTVALGLLTLGVVAESALEASYRTPRPPLNAPLATIPLELGRWVGRDEAMDPAILREAQCDDYLNRVYEDPHRPGRQIRVWMNYSVHGLNLRHSPEICLPSGGWSKIESHTRVLQVERPGVPALPVMRLGYAQGEMVQGIGFWYYIFGEGPLEHFARTLPIANRSSHGRTTRGSGLTVEIFSPGEHDPEGESLREFAAAVAGALEPLLPADRANYYIP